MIRARLTPLLATALLLTVGWLLWKPSRPPNPTPASSDTSSPAPDRSGPETTRALHPIPVAPTPAASNPCARALGLLRSAVGPTAAQSVLASLRQDLTNLPTGDASASIRTFLETGRDSATSLGFAVGPGGSLLESPSLRIFLLDLLGALDPVGAAAYAETVLKGSASPDEWAVAMRNLARARTDDSARAILEERMTRLLRNEAWSAQPTAGFLEAFDVAVYLGNPALVPDLTALVNTNRHPASAHAAFLALDRMIQNKPVPILTALLRDPTGLAGHEATRASYFARANVEDPSQRRLVEVYLLDLGRSAEERQAFADVFPNGNYMMSHNLLTRNAEPDPNAQAHQDRQTLRVVEGWLADSRFERLRPELETIRQRLTRFVESAKRAP